MVRTFFILLLISVGVTSCNEVNPKGEEEVREFVKSWNSLHTPIKAANLKHNYIDVVQYYDAELTKEQVQEDKNQLFVVYPDYQQEIVPNSIKIENDGANYLVSFDKKVRYKGLSETYPSFLSVIYKNGEFKILREGLEPSGTELNNNSKLFPTKETLDATFNKSPRLYGDFNGDGLSEYAYVVLSPNTSETKRNTTTRCDGCEASINFSKKEISPILVKGVYNFSLENLKDLNGDAADEIGFFIVQPASQTLLVFDPVTGASLTEPVTINTTVHKNMKLIDILKKSGPNKITVTESVEENGTWSLKSKIIRLQ